MINEKIKTFFHLIFENNRFLVAIGDSFTQLSFVLLLVILSENDKTIVDFYLFITFYSIANLIIDSGHITYSTKCYGVKANPEIFISHHFLFFTLTMLVVIFFDNTLLYLGVITALFSVLNQHIFLSIKFNEKNFFYFLVKLLGSILFISLTIFLKDKILYYRQISLLISFTSISSLLIILKNQRISFHIKFNVLIESLKFSPFSYNGWLRNGFDKILLVEFATSNFFATYSKIQQFMVILQFLGTSISRILIVPLYDTKIGAISYKSIYNTHFVIFISSLPLLLICIYYFNEYTLIVILLFFISVLYNINTIEIPLFIRIENNSYLTKIFTFSNAGYLLVLIFSLNIYGVILASFTSILIIFLYNMSLWKKWKYYV